MKVQPRVRHAKASYVDNIFTASRRNVYLQADRGGVDLGRGGRFSTVYNL
jgi:hypothetical protein